MTLTLYLGIGLVAAFLLQGLLGFIQIKNFSQNYRELRQHGRVLIGKNPKRLQAGSLLLLAIDLDGNIKEARIMKGVTIFAHFKQLPLLKQHNIVVVAADNEMMQQVDKLTRGCILNAYRNFVNFKTGQLAYDDLNTNVNIFSMPLFEKIKQLYHQLNRLIGHQLNKVRRNEL
ncbi:sorbitol operon activator [Lactobacillus plantarum WCFS1] [Lactiplantibacillus mudanjiangensis]|uniref:transcriptional regulator GutM n=1 Tax=Lactiplantibacillus mudanjiangensis TaxID=1296538 RepID=UPI0010141BA7|nr:transcriptional regulator GutM [Lactiplantibacillus mudanjiangensis]VDG20869.1 sorbitol operon activator [Lactobacillus plantarum WCFS1] [Lactiplantibacillus mudanjiangensis]VDG32002.1 sorbitol operon activator [Lactobacillus plantarum WCFS1] [Lactiplantibacillus mudanjiangensis]